MSLSDHEFGASAPDVHDQPAAVLVRQQMTDPEIDEPGFLRARNDLDAVPERLRRLAEERLPVLHLPERVRSHGARLAGGNVPDAFPDPRQRRLRPLPGGRFDGLVPDPGRKAHRLLHPVHDLGVLAVHPGHGEVEAAGTEVHRGEQAHREVSFRGHARRRRRSRSRCSGQAAGGTPGFPLFIDSRSFPGGPLASPRRGNLGRRRCAGMF